MSRTETIALIASRLKSKIQSLQSSIRTEDAATASRSVMSDDISGEAAMSEQAEISGSITSANSRFLKEIHETILKIEDGSYGICEDCESEIALLRLEAVPTAQRCIKCQQAAEEEADRSGQPIQRKNYDDVDVD